MHGCKYPHSGSGGEHGAGCQSVLRAGRAAAAAGGAGSARELDRRCDPDTGEVPFQWICGGVTVNYHTLADFRVGHVEVLDDLLTNGVAVLLEQDLVSMERVAQDGMKVRASAGVA